MKRSSKLTPHVADICLYGAMHCGYGWLATSADGRMFGDGELHASRSLTETVWLAQGSLEAAGVANGRVRVFAPGGQRMAVLPRLATRSYYGELAWGPAPVIEVHLN